MARKRNVEEEYQDTGIGSTPMNEGPEGLEAPAAEGTAEDPVFGLAREVEEWKDRYSRALADMENLKRRTQREAEDARKYANERLIGDLLPVLDNFARALCAAEQADDFAALKTGVEQIHRLLDDVLTRAGLERIAAQDQPFDPNLHEAIMQVAPEPGQEPHQVVEELRAGYRLHERVVRPALVKVTSG